MLFDLHVHSTLSACSSLPLADILSHARARGLDGVCITDHDTMDALKEVREGVQPDGLCVVVGMEYATAQGDFLVFGPFEDLQPGMPATKLLDVVAQRGGAAVAAHPFRQGRGVDREIIRSGQCRTVERINGRTPTPRNALVDGWLARWPLTACGGSDAHTLPELGRVATRFDASITSRADLVMALRAGQCRPERLRPRPAELHPAVLAASA